MPVFLRWLLDLGPTNPIAVRLVQNGSRRVKHLYVRSAYLAVLIVVLLWLLVIRASGQAALNYADLAKVGAQAFTWIAFLQISLIAILSPVFMAGAIAQESDPRTWDILLTTPMNKLQIVLGNLIGRLLFVLGLLFCSLPLFTLTQFFGGVPGESIFASYLISASAAVLVGAIAIALSTSRLAGRRAVFTFYIAVVSYLAVTAAIDAVIRQSGGGAGPSGTGVTATTALNPFLALHALLNPSTYPRADIGDASGLMDVLLRRPVVAWCSISLGLSVLLTLGSTLTVSSGGLAGAAKSRRMNVWLRRMLRLSSTETGHRPPREVGSNPIAWREATARNATLGRIIARWAFVGAGLVFGLGLVIGFHAGMIPGAAEFRLLLLWTVSAELMVITLVAINMAATSISREREDGTLDILLTTPITPGAYLWGKLRGLIAYLIPLLLVPVGTLLMAGAYVATLGPSRAGGVDVVSQLTSGPITTPALLPEAGVIVALTAIPFVAFCVMIGLQWSLKSRGTIGSVVGAVGVIGVAGGAVGLCAWTSMAQIEGIGPALAGLSPASAAFAVLSPGIGMESTLRGGTSLDAARLSLAIGAVVGAGVHLVVVYAIHGAMVKNFDFTVRRLAGTR